MILSFSSIFPHNGNRTHFRQCVAEPNEQDYKYHTIRGLTHGTTRRWRPGMKIHFWMGSPRMKHRFCWIHSFTDDYKSYHQEEPIVQATEDIAIVTWQFKEHCRAVVFVGNKVLSTEFRYIDQCGENLVKHETIIRLAKNDGFATGDDFLSYFHFQNRKAKTRVFKGQIVHWTKHLCYDSKSAQTIKSPEPKTDLFNLPVLISQAQA